LFRESARCLRAKAPDSFEASGVITDRFEGARAEPVYDALSDRRPDAMEGRRGEIDDEPLCVDRCQELKLFKGELFAMAWVFFPAALDAYALADLGGGGAPHSSDTCRSKEAVGRQVLAVLGLDPEDRVEGLRVREGDDLDRREEGLKTPRRGVRLSSPGSFSCAHMCRITP
jgi:hypothetical protein